MIDAFQTRRAGMTLYSLVSCIEGHACRMVLHEKEVECDVEYVQRASDPKITENNPYGESPALVDRELVLYGSHIIAEYLDDRLPHPPLMPPDPSNRSKVRMMIYRAQRDWFGDLRRYEEKKQKPPKTLRNKMQRDLSVMAQYFGSQQFWLEGEFTLVDCFFAPLLWRLPHYGIELPAQARVLNTYAHRLFKRTSFTKSLSPYERELQPN